MRALDCCQSRTSPVSRKSQPLPTMPCFEGAIPVSIVAWAVQVTAGMGLRQGWGFPTDEILGAWARSLGVSPTTLITQTLPMGRVYQVLCIPFAVDFPHPRGAICRYPLCSKGVDSWGAR